MGRFSKDNRRSAEVSQTTPDLMKHLSRCKEVAEPENESENPCHTGPA